MNRLLFVIVNAISILTSTSSYTTILQDSPTKRTFSSNNKILLNRDAIFSASKVDKYTSRFQTSELLDTENNRTFPLPNEIVNWNAIQNSREDRAFPSIWDPPKTVGNKSKVRFSILDFGAVGDGSHDDAPAFRAAIAACSANPTSYRSLYVPIPSVAYLFKSLDPSGLGAVVIGDGISDQSCAIIEGEGANAWGNWVGGVNIKLDSGLNRPVFRLRSGAGGVILKNLRIDGNGGAQSSYADSACGGKLYTICAEDGSAHPEGAFSFEQTWVTNGYNGNYYQGWGRGMSTCYHATFEYGSQGYGDYSVVFNGYDTDWFACGVGGSHGGGVFYGAGSQHHWVGGAVWMNDYDGITVDGGKVNHLTISDMNLQYNGCNGLNELTGAPFAGLQSAGHLFTNITFDSNSHTKTNTCSDVKSANSLVSLVSPAFNGAVTLTNPMPKYNVELSGNSANVQMTSPKFTGAPNGTAITNDFTKLDQFQKGEVHIGNVAPASETTLTVDTRKQSSGIFVSNGTNILASLIGASVTNDGGLLKLLVGGATKTQIHSSGDSFINGGRLGVGNSHPSTTLDVTGTIRAGTYNISTLPMCSSAILGALATVSDGLSWPKTYGASGSDAPAGSPGTAVIHAGTVTRSVICTNAAGSTSYAWIYN